MKKIKSSIIICTLNEVNFIEKTVRAVDKKLKYNEIIVVDDNSSDGTVNKLKLLKKKINFKLLVRKNKKGLASAIVDGFKISKGKYVGFIEASSPDQISYFKNMIKKLDKDGYDMAILSRYVRGGRDNRVFFRSFSSFLINNISKFILQIEFNDFTSGIFVMKKSIFKKVSININDYGDYFIEFVYRIFKKKYKVIEIPYKQKRDPKNNNSKTSPNFYIFLLHGVNYFFKVIKTRLNN